MKWFRNLEEIVSGCFIMFIGIACVIAAIKILFDM